MAALGAAQVPMQALADMEMLTQERKLAWEVVRTQEAGQVLEADS